jgi:predicted short-subunit dehydrogenase-like oxidoreductase (DUF2520 family)
MIEQVFVVGPGRVGKCLALVHQRAGAQVFVLGRQQGLWMDWARAHAMKPLLQCSEAPRENVLVLLAVPDRELSAAVKQCQEHLSGARNALVHMSGVYGLELFDSVGEGQTQSAAIHPLMAFGGDPEVDATALATSMASVATRAREQDILVEVLACWGVRGLPLAASVDRRRYHLGLSLLSNHVTALCGWAHELLEPALGSESQAVIQDMVQRAVDSVSQQGAAAALTGPVVRGDVATIQAHLVSLSPAEAVRYRGALLAVIDLALASGRLSLEAAEEIRALAAAVPIS